MFYQSKLRVARAESRASVVPCGIIPDLWWFVSIFFFNLKKEKEKKHRSPWFCKKAPVRKERTRSPCFVWSKGGARLRDALHATGPHRAQYRCAYTRYNRLPRIAPRPGPRPPGCEAAVLVARRAVQRVFIGKK